MQDINVEQSLAMDLSYSKKVMLIDILRKLIKFPEPNYPIGSMYYDTRSNRMYIYMVDSWIRVG